MNLTISTLIDALQYVDPRTENIRFQYDGNIFTFSIPRIYSRCFLSTLFMIFSRRIRECELRRSSIHGAPCPKWDVKGSSLQSTSSRVSFRRWNKYSPSRVRNIFICFCFFVLRHGPSLTVICTLTLMPETPSTPIIFLAAGNQKAM